MHPSLWRRTVPTAVVLATAATPLAACASGDGFGDLARQAQANDPLPEAVTFSDIEIAPESSRMVGTHEGTDLWLVRTETGGVCLLAYPDEEEWVAGCSDGTPLNVSGPAGSFTVIADGEEPPDGAAPVTENVFVW